MRSWVCTWGNFYQPVIRKQKKKPTAFLLLNDLQPWFFPLWPLRKSDTLHIYTKREKSRFKLQPVVHLQQLGKDVVPPLHTSSAIQASSLHNAARLKAKGNDRTMKHCMNKFHSMSCHIRLVRHGLKETEGLLPCQTLKPPFLFSVQTWSWQFNPHCWSLNNH